MVISLDGQTSRVRQWYRNHVHLMYHFRVLYEQLYKQEKATRHPQEKKRMRQRMARLQNKIEQHMTYGEFLGLKDAQMREFNLAIIDEMKRGKEDPKAIIQALIRGNSQK